MLVNRTTWPQHRPWIFLSLALVIAGALGHIAEWVLLEEPPSGSSLVGMLTGILAGAIILFEMALWLRKKLRIWRALGPAKRWMIAHLWLGLTVVPLAFFHANWQFGGMLSTLLLILLVVVVSSGIAGLLLQQIIPSRLLNEVPSETIYSQIDRMVLFLRRDAARVIESCSGINPLSEGDTLEQEEEFEKQRLKQSYLVVGAVRAIGSISGRVFNAQTRPVVIADSEALLRIYKSDIDPFLRPGTTVTHPLARSDSARVAFANFRRNTEASVHPVLDELEDLCSQRRQLLKQSRLQAWLHTWLLIHWPLSIALTLLLFLHVFVAIKYW